jgi:hypothetical protein
MTVYKELNMMTAFPYSVAKFLCNLENRFYASAGDVEKLLAFVISCGQETVLK